MFITEEYSYVSSKYIGSHAHGEFSPNNCGYNTEQWCTLNQTNILYRNCRPTIHNNHKQ